MQVYDCDKFYIFALRKAGTSSLQKWAEIHNVGFCTIDPTKTTKNIYSFWRPTYGRIITGINTGLNYTAWQGVDNIMCRVNYYYHLHCLLKSKNLNKDHNVKKHTRLLKNLTDNTINYITWIYMEDMHKFHTYIFSMYNKQYKPLPHINKGNGADWFNTDSFRSTTPELNKILECNPEFMVFLKDYANSDEVPKKVYRIQELMSVKK